MNLGVETAVEQALLYNERVLNDIEDVLQTKKMIAKEKRLLLEYKEDLENLTEKIKNVRDAKGRFGFGQLRRQKAMGKLLFSVRSFKKKYEKGEVDGILKREGIE